MWPDTIIDPTTDIYASLYINSGEPRLYFADPNYKERNFSIALTEPCAGGCPYGRSCGPDFITCDVFECGASSCSDCAARDCIWCELDGVAAQCVEGTGQCTILGA